MIKNSFYVDTCVYINLWHKEENKRMGVQFWKLAQGFFNKYDNENTLFYYSGHLLRELQFVLSEEEFTLKCPYFNSSPNFVAVTATVLDIKQARKMESILNYEISFYDVIHMILATKTNSILVTRDRKLLNSARKFAVVARRPEEL